MNLDILSWLSGLFDNVLANLVASGIAAILVLFFGVMGIKKKPQTGEKIVSVDNSGNYVGEINGSNNQVTQTNTHIDNSIRTNTVNKNYGAQSQASSDDDTFLIFAGAVLGLGVILTATLYLHYLIAIPLWVAGTVLLVGGLFFWKQENLYSVAAKSKTYLSGFTLATTAVLLSLTIFTVQNPQNLYSLGRLSQQIETQVPESAGWLKSIIARTGELSFDGTMETKVILGVGVLGFIIAAGLFLMALTRVLGSLLLPATSNGRTFGKYIVGRTLNNFNSDFVKSKVWGYAAILFFSVLIFFLTTDQGVELLFHLGDQISDIAKRIVETA